MMFAITWPKRYKVNSALTETTIFACSTFFHAPSPKIALVSPVSLNYPQMINAIELVDIMHEKLNQVGDLRTGLLYLPRSESLSSDLYLTRK